MREKDFDETEEPLEPEVQDFRPYQSHQSLFPFKAKLIFWSTLVGGIAIGTFLFLFFISIFVQLFLPLVAVYLLYHLFRRLRR